MWRLSIISVESELNERLKGEADQDLKDGIYKTEVFTNSDFELESAIQSN